MFDVQSQAKEWGEVMASSKTNRSEVVTGMFRDRESAERAYQSLAARGYGRDDVNVIMSMAV